jgi:hypothetical protein
VGRESFEKREREKKRQQRSAEKRQRREARDADIGGGTVDSDALMERFRVLSERYEAGAVTHEQYEAERLQIFSELGLDANTR